MVELSEEIISRTIAVARRLAMRGAIPPTAQINRFINF